MSAVTDKELFTIFFILGRGPEDWEFLQDNWSDDYEPTTNLNWDQFLSIESMGWDALHDSFRELFGRSLLNLNKNELLKKIYPEISSDSENWNDFFDMLVDATDFDDLWDNSWLTRDEMENSLEEYMEENDGYEADIKKFKEEFRAWFESEGRVNFRKEAVELLNSLALVISKARD